MAAAAKIFRETELDYQVAGCAMPYSGFFNSINSLAPPLGNRGRFPGEVVALRAVA